MFLRKNWFPVLTCGFNVGGEKRESKTLTLSLGHVEALSERQCRISRLSTASCGPKRGEMLRLVDDFDETISKSLTKPRNVCDKSTLDAYYSSLKKNVQKNVPLLTILTFHWLAHRRGFMKVVGLFKRVKKRDTTGNGRTVA